ncbi:MAG: GDSL-type esterase/lipase family protein [Bacteroidia bacterium]|nr:GDSL-type esterase/lipase family protein [Bacteroidia bacterium]
MGLTFLSRIRGISLAILVSLGYGLVGGGLRLQAQVTPWPFIRIEQNHILGAEVGLRHFYERLARLEAGDTHRVSVVHIGDSHIQCDWFSGPVRDSLQAHFGHAGRGLVFPYAVAGTNSPSDIRSYATGAATFKRNIHLTNPIPAGIAGITLQTADPAYRLQVSLADGETFDRVTVVTDTGHHTLQWQIGSITGEPTDLVLPVAHTLPSKRISTLDPDMWVAPVVRPPYLPAHQFPQPVNTCRLTLHQTGTPIQPSRLYGLILEHAQVPGVLYHSIGVNGAQFRHYNASPAFWDQLTMLQPDLVILSLGTNEAYQPGFSMERFFQEMDRMVYLVQQHAPFADILLITPGDAWRARKYVNRDLPELQALMTAYARENSLACWDFFDIMGGSGSIQQWYLSGLAQPDRLHLTKRGYNYQAQLLVHTLLHGYRHPGSRF